MPYEVFHTLNLTGAFNISNAFFVKGVIASTPVHKQEIILLPHNPDIKRNQKNSPFNHEVIRLPHSPSPKTGPNKTITIAHFISDSNDALTYINFLEISESPCSPNKPEEANNNTANAAKMRIGSTENYWSLQGAFCD